MKAFLFTYTFGYIYIYVGVCANNMYVKQNSIQRHCECFFERFIPPHTHTHTHMLINASLSLVLTHIMQRYDHTVDESNNVAYSVYEQNQAHKHNKPDGDFASCSSLSSSHW